MRVPSRPPTAGVVMSGRAAANPDTAAAADADAAAVEDVLSAFLVSLVKSACQRVGDDSWALFMSEADVSDCVAAQLRECGVCVEREHPIVPVWRTEGGQTVTLHSRRADIAVGGPCGSGRSQRTPPSDPARFRARRSTSGARRARRACLSRSSWGRVLTTSTGSRRSRMPAQRGASPFSRSSDGRRRSRATR